MLASDSRPASGDSRSAAGKNRSATSRVGASKVVSAATAQNAYGQEDVDDAELEHASSRAGALWFIQKLPRGFDTMVGERGVKLSGGQRQRVALARVVLTDPEILILDEATSHVDNETEVLIRDRLGDLIEDQTTIAIAHRLSTVRNADTILVMDGGRLVEQGSHEDLLTADGLYANLWRVQAGEIQSLPEEFIARAAEREETRTVPDDGFGPDISGPGSDESGL